MPLPLLPLIPILASAAPSIIKWIAGENAGAAAEKVSAVAREVFGTDDPDAVRTAIATDPNLALQLQMAVLEREKAAEQAALDTLKTQLADVASARSQTVELAKAGSPIAWGSSVVSVLAVCVFGGFVYMMFRQEVPEGMREALMLMAGSTAAGFGAVLNYWLGSSAGSAQKTGALETLARKR